jgi:two-component system, OmpR family, sensor histidine kinase ChvG
MRLPFFDSTIRLGWRRPSKLTARILAINIVALATLAGGFLYMGRYQDRLAAAELDALTLQARIFASTLAEGALVHLEQHAEDEAYALSEEVARQMVRRVVETTDTRTRLYHAGGHLISDSRVLAGARGVIQIEEIPPLPSANQLKRITDYMYDYFFDLMPSRLSFPLYPDQAGSAAAALNVEKALNGELTRGVWRAHRVDGGHDLMLSVAAPVQRYKQVLGAVLLTRAGKDIDAALRAVRLDILKVFGFALSLTVLLSWFLAGTIARPIRRLAQAAEQVRLGHGRDTVIPDMTARGDEIGELSAALRDMTAAQWARMDAIERFAADVAHEIKNPLTSLRSAVETVQRVGDGERRDRLLAIIAEDVLRLDRLITDISNASRLDAELSRADYETVDVSALLETLAEIHASAAEWEAEESPAAHRPVVRFLQPPQGDCPVKGLEGHLTQIFQNLIGNALSFSPPGGVVEVTARRDRAWVEVAVADQGPGIPPGKEEAIFQRFYSERPAGEAFGRHSGLGLSIARRIAEMHGGEISAQNIIDSSGAIRGARFILRLPRVHTP